MAEIDPAGGHIVRSYAWGASLVGGGSTGALLQITLWGNGTPGTRYFPTYDGNGNVTALVRDDATGTVAAVYEYGPFGEPLRAEKLDPAIGDQPFRFSTQFTDEESGLIYYGLRYYSPALGRFINRDPIEEAGGLNLYGFCANDGVNRWDYLGMQEVPATQGRSETTGTGSGTSGLFTISPLGPLNQGSPAIVDIDPDSPPGIPSNSRQVYGTELGQKRRDEAVGPAPNSAETTGYLVGVGGELEKTGVLRLEYDELVRKLRALPKTPEADAIRRGLTEEFQKKQTALGRAKTGEVLNERARLKELGYDPPKSNAGKTNEAITKQGRMVKTLGRGMVVVGVGLEVKSIIDAPEGQKGEAAVDAGGRLLGGAVGGQLGAELGIPFGPPGVLVGAGLGGIGGAIVGPAGIQVFRESLRRPLTPEEADAVMRAIQ